MNVGAFYPQCRQFSFARAFGARGALWNSLTGGVPEKRTLCEKTLLAHVECVTCIEVELVYRRERQTLTFKRVRKHRG